MTERDSPQPEPVEIRPKLNQTNFWTNARAAREVVDRQGGRFAIIPDFGKQFMEEEAAHDRLVREDQEFRDGMEAVLSDSLESAVADIIQARECIID